MDAEFSVGWAVGAREHAAIAALPQSAWSAAIGVDGEPRDPADSAAVAELTGMFPTGALREYPDRMRVIARRERPHPGAQLDLIEEADGWRYTCFATNTHTGQDQWLDSATVPTPASRTGSAAARTPAWAGSRPRCSRSTKPGLRAR